MSSHRACAIAVLAALVVQPAAAQPAAAQPAAAQAIVATGDDRPPSNASIGQAPGSPVDADDATAESALAAAQAVYGPPDRRRCLPSSGGSGNEIVVCGTTDNARFRVSSSADLDPAGLGSKGGVPRAPDVYGIGDVGPVVARGCFIPPCPPPAAYMIDLAAIPEAPAGSDADKIARGEVRVR